MTDGEIATTSRDGRGRILAGLALRLAAVALSAVNASWLERNGFFERPYTSDAAWYRIDALMMKRGADDGLLGWFRAGLAHARAHPPGVVMVAGLVASVRGDDGVSPFSGFLAIQIFAALYVFGSYRLARNFGGRGAAVGAALLAAAFPGILAHWRPLYPQFPMCAALVWCFDALLRTRGFTLRGRSIVFGVVAGGATMLKMLAPLYFGGSAAAVLVFGLVSAPTTRKKTFLNVVLGAAAAMSIILPWYAPNWHRVMGYATEVTGDAGQSMFSAALPQWSAPRWLFYPWHLLNGGVGWFFAPVFLAAVAAGVLATLRLRRSAAASQSALQSASDPTGSQTAARTAAIRDGWILCAGPLVAFVPLTIGQTAAGPFYLSGFLVLAAILICRFVAGLRSQALRVGLAVLLGSAGIVYLGSAQRAPEADLPVYFNAARPALKFREHPTADGRLPLEFLPRADDVYGSFLAFARGVGKNPPEDWPNARIVTLIKARSTRPQPVLAQTTPFFYTHPYCGHPQIAYEAEMQGVRLKYVEPESWTSAGLDPLTEAAQCDYLLIDERPLPGLYSADLVLAGLKSRGVDGKIVLHERPTPWAAIALIEVRRPGIIAGPRPPTDLDAAGVRRTRVEYGNGYTLVGLRKQPGGDGKPVLNAWFETDPTAESPVLTHVYLNVDGKVVKTAKAMLRAPVLRGELFAATFEGLPVPAAESKAVFHLRVASLRPDAHKNFARVGVTQERRNGNAAVEIPFDLATPRPASGPTSLPASRGAASRPASRPVSRPISRPATRVSSGKATSRPTDR